ncbi:MAG: two-component system, cell cycle response regulator [Acidobacteriota bacterium]|jgi:diguanylate cyclase (GGDEF)-like protein|nr:two-component system, cell cycle response regulator [Acidobacteriota bacterium]
MISHAGVYSERSDLIAGLRRACPEWTFSDGADRDASRIALVDAGVQRPAGKSIVRVMLVEHAFEGQRKHGELLVDREAFLRAPGEYLEFAADLAEAAMHAAQLEQEAAYLRQIHDLMTMVDADDVSERITTTVLSLLGLERGTLFLHDPRLERYVVSFSNDPGYQETNDFLPGVPPDILQHALASPDLFASSRDAKGRGIIIMPLQVREDLLAVIRIPLEPGDELVDETTAGVTKYLAAVTQVLSNIYQLTRSRDLAMRDDLTKAYNRRFFESYLDEEIERSRRYGTLFSIIFLDLDDLKMVNNFYGHLSGSRTLQEVAKRILGAVRGIDKTVRFGGDEFCVILPNTDQEQAVMVANRISRAISSSPLTIDANLDVSITASFGIATYPTHAMSKEGLIRQADAAMYRVKSTTKNAVGVAELSDATRPI